MHDRNLDQLRSGDDVVGAREEGKRCRSGVYRCPRRPVSSARGLQPALSRWNDLEPVGVCSSMPPNRYAEAHVFLGVVKKRFVLRPAVYSEMVKNLNQFKRANNSEKENARNRVEALLAAEADLLAGFREFVPVAAPEGARIGTGEGQSLDDAIVLDSDDEAGPAVEEEDAVEIVGSNGSNALADFPHPRHACVVHPFPEPGSEDRRTRARVHCDKCFCFLCDSEADKCVAWDEHSIAQDDAGWLAVRAALRPPAAPAVTHAPPAPTRAPRAHKRPRRR